MAINIDNQNEVIKADSGVIQVKGDIWMEEGKGLRYPASGPASRFGQVTLVAGGATISTTSVQANSIIFLTQMRGTVLASLLGGARVGIITPGTSFTIESTNILDVSKVNWMVINPQ